MYSKKRSHVRVLRHLPLIFLMPLLMVACDRQQAQQAPPVPEVTVVTVAEEPVVLTSELPGRTSAYRVAEVRPQVSGIILHRKFEEGSKVAAGQVLYEIDPAPFQAAYESAAATQARAEARVPALRMQLDRFRELLPVNAVSKQTVDDAESALKQAEADVAYYKAAVSSARINLDYTRIIAPISGRIGKSSVTEGALVTAAQPTALSVIQQLDPMYVDVPQSTAELLRLKRRMAEGRLETNGADQKKVRLYLDDGTAYAQDGNLQFRDVTVDASTGAVTLRAVFPNPEDMLLPGMFVRAMVQEGANRHAVLIPQQAVSRDTKGNPLCLVIDGEGKAQQRSVVLDRAMGDRWMVTSGLASGEQVIIEGKQKVRPGGAVKVVPSDPGTLNPKPGQAAPSPAASK